VDYKDAAAELLKLIDEIERDETLTAAGLEMAGAVHTEALLASLAAFNQAMRIAKASHDTETPKKETKSGAQLQPMPEETMVVQIDFPLTAEQYAVLQSGAAPADDFDRWHMDIEGNHIRYYRNATGFCFFDGEIEKNGDGYRINNVVVNQNDKQYSETIPGVCAAQMKILLANNLGLDDEPYWDEMDEASDE
jgi:hypothetical protein